MIKEFLDPEVAPWNVVYLTPRNLVILCLQTLAFLLSGNALTIIIQASASITIVINASIGERFKSK